MFSIKKMRADNVIDFAAEELKKYLWMMMPECSDIPISFDSDAKDGFRLGLLEDFGLPNEAKDPNTDDVVHVDTTENGGILAGSNPRSVLFAVYRYLRLNGCRWLFPGVDGEHIPRQPVTAQRYHKLADHHVRGYTIEGDPSVEQVLDYIDYHAKKELNYFAPTGIHTYHYRYYNHDRNTMNREPEPVTPSLIDQWEGLFVAEARKRGLRVKRGNAHGAVPAAIGLNPHDRAAYKSGEKVIPEEIKPKLALINGKRDLYRKDIYYTNLCLSQPDVRKAMVDYLADTVESSRAESIALPFADGNHNHCECEECSKVRPSDWLVVMGNELDEELNRRGLPDVNINFSTYVDKMFAPIREKFNHPERFSITFSPISRSYTSSITENSVIPEPLPYVRRNVWDAPKSMEECVAHLMDWRKQFDGPCTTFEYHFWRAQIRDPGLMDISRRVYEDVRAFKLLNIQGITEDGSNKHFFPHGFHEHIYAEVLIDRDCDYDAVMEDYFFHLYGEDWKQVKAYLTGISNAFGEKYMAGEDSSDREKGTHYNPARAAELSKVAELAAVARELAAKHKVMPTRAQTVAYRLLNRHAEYCEKLAEVFIAKCQGYDKLAVEKMNAFAADYGRHDYELERYLDFGLAVRTLEVVAKQMPTIEF